MADTVEKKKASSQRSAPASGAPAFSIEDLKTLFLLMKENEIAELNLEQQDTRIRIISTHAPVSSAPHMTAMMPTMQPMGMMGMPQQVAAPPPAPAAPAAEPTKPAAAEESAPSNQKTVHSPMVGTLYRAPAPDAPPFVKVGDRVSEDTVLCIVEAMKLMNEIKAEMKGKIHKIMVENGMPVQYNQPLFLVEPE